MVGDGPRAPGPPLTGLEASMTRAQVAVSTADDADLILQEVELGALRPDEVVVDVVSAGICHTDIASHHGLYGTKKPVVLGHEGAGVVREVGAGVSDIRAGDRVVMTMSGCGACRACVSGDTTYCSQIF